MGSRFMSAPKPPAVETDQRRPETESLPVSESMDAPPPVIDTQLLDVPMTAPNILEAAPLPAESIQSATSSELPQGTILEPPPGAAANGCGWSYMSYMTQPMLVHRGACTWQLYCVSLCASRK